SPSEKTGYRKPHRLSKFVRHADTVTIYAAEMKRTKLGILKGMLAVMAAATSYPLPTCALARDFPTQNVQIVVPFTPGATVNATVVNPAASFDTLPAMIAFARANPGRLRYGSAGPGSNMHLAMEMLKSLAKIDILHVPYKGIAPATAATMSGEVDMMFAGYS